MAICNATETQEDLFLGFEFKFWDRLNAEASMIEILLVLSGNRGVTAVLKKRAMKEIESQPSDQEPIIGAHDYPNRMKVPISYLDHVGQHITDINEKHSKETNKMTGNIHITKKETQEDSNVSMEISLPVGEGAPQSLQRRHADTEIMNIKGEWWPKEKSLLQISCTIIAGVILINRLKEKKWLYLPFCDIKEGGSTHTSLDHMDVQNQQFCCLEIALCSVFSIYIWNESTNRSMKFDGNYEKIIKFTMDLNVIWGRALLLYVVLVTGLLM
ncbi:hypothetical protein ACJX0J_032137, partial [Zea mays]